MLQLALKTIALSGICFSLSTTHLKATTTKGQHQPIEILPIQILSYDSLVSKDEKTLLELKKALLEKGIVGVKNIPGYKEKLSNYIASSRKFASLPEDVKSKYSPDRSNPQDITGHEQGKEKFQRPDGSWIVDDLKVSYYGFVPDTKSNRWPEETDLKTPFLEMGLLMGQVGKLVMTSVGLLGDKTGIHLRDTPQLGRSLYYQKSSNSAQENPFWCGGHFDHGMFTALLPSFYFINGKQVEEPLEAGLFVKTTKDGMFRKVLANDHNVMMFQVGEFGQLATNDAIKATEHYVHKANATNIERYTMALFFDAPMDTVIQSSSVLANDSRYCQSTPLTPCTYKHWSDESFKRYLVE